MLEAARAEAERTLKVCVCLTSCLKLTAPGLPRSGLGCWRPGAAGADAGAKLEAVAVIAELVAAVVVALLLLPPSRGALMVWRAAR